MPKWIYITIAVLLIITAATTWLLLPKNNSQSTKARTVPVQRQSVIQDVTFTGRLTTIKSSDISFELPGTITQMFVSEGQTVIAGQKIATIDTSAVDLELAQAQATLTSTKEQTYLAWQQAQADLINLQQTDKETIAKRKQAVRDAKAELDQTKQVHIQRAKESGDNSVLTKSAIATIKSAEAAYHTAQQNLEETLASTQRTETQSQDTINTAKTKYDTTVQRGSHVAGLSSLTAQKKLVENKVQRHTLIAPFAGTITTVYREVGEAALATNPVVTVATANELELSATVTETDATKVAPGLPATVTFDALPNQEEWNATITYVAPAAKIIEGIPTYLIKLSLSKLDDRFRDGLTSNITVHASRKDNVLAIPRRAVITEDTAQSILIANDKNEPIKQTITTGLVGSDGLVEVTSGLNEGNVIVVNPEQLNDQ